MDTFPNDPLSNVLAFLTAKEAGCVANTCKHLRKEVKKNTYQLHCTFNYDFYPPNTKYQS